MTAMLLALSLLAGDQPTAVAPGGGLAVGPSLRPATAIWTLSMRPPAGTESPAAERTPPPNQRFTPPARGPLVGYAPQAAQPLPAYPGVPGTAGGEHGFPSRLAGTGPLASLFTDLKASQPGDVVTIIITTQAVAAANAKKQSGQSAEAGFNGGSGLFSFLPDLGLKYESQRNGDTNDTSNFSINTTFTAVVVEVAPNGNLIVEGEQTVDIDGKPQWVKLRGEIRPYDVSADNTIPSTKVANVSIEFQGTRSTARRPGLLQRVGHAIESLFSIFF